jgi:hypothetical protein
MKIQATTYVKVFALHIPAVVRLSEMENVINVMDQYRRRSWHGITPRPQRSCLHICFQ